MYLACFRWRITGSTSISMVMEADQRTEDAPREYAFAIASAIQTTPQPKIVHRKGGKKRRESSATIFSKPRTKLPPYRTITYKDNCTISSSRLLLILKEPDVKELRRSSNSLLQLLSPILAHPLSLELQRDMQHNQAQARW